MRAYLTCLGPWQLSCLMLLIEKYCWAAKRAMNQIWRAGRREIKAIKSCLSFPLSERLHIRSNNQQKINQLHTTKSLCMLSRIGCLPASIANGPLPVSKGHNQPYPNFNSDGQRYAIQNIKSLTCKFWSSVSINRLRWDCVSKWINDHI